MQPFLRRSSGSPTGSPKSGRLDSIRRSFSSNSPSPLRNLFRESRTEASKYATLSNEEVPLDGGTLGVPLKTVRGLLLGQVDPIDLAKQILSPGDAKVVMRLNTEHYREKTKVEKLKIYTVQDVIFVSLCYVGFDAERQGSSDGTARSRFQSFFKACPEAVLDLKNHLDEGESVEFKHLLWTLNFLKLREYFIPNGTTSFPNVLNFHAICQTIPNMYLQGAGWFMKIH